MEAGDGSTPFSQRRRGAPVPTLTPPALALWSRPSWTAPNERVVVVKATFTIVPDGAAALHDEPAPLSGEVGHDPDQPTSTPVQVDDFAGPKPRAEVVFHAAAYPPPGRGAMRVRVRFGGDRGFDRSLLVLGERRWERAGPSAPQPFERLPLIWEHAAGGPGHELNPVGTLAAAPPRIEHPDRPVRTPDDAVAPMGIAPIPAAWPGRLARLGTFDASWPRARWPYLPADHDPGFGQAAPPPQQLDAIAADEAFELVGLRPDRPVLKGRLGGVVVRCYARRALGELEQVPVALDTVAFDTEAMRIHQFWRGRLPVADFDASDLSALFVLLLRPGETAPSPGDVARACDLAAMGLPAALGGATALAAAAALMESVGEAPGGAEVMSGVQGDPEAPLAGAAAEPVDELEPDGQPPADATAPDVDAALQQAVGALRGASGPAGDAVARAVAALGPALLDGSLDLQKVLGALESRGLKPPPGVVDRLMQQMASPASPPSMPRREAFDQLLAAARQANAQDERLAELEQLYAEAVAMEEAAATGATATAATEGRADGPADAAPCGGADTTALDAERTKVLVALDGGGPLDGMDLSGMDLSGRDLSGRSFVGANLSDVKAVGTVLSGAKLVDAVLARADLTDAKLDAADLRRADAHEAILSGASLKRATMEHTSFAKAVGRGCAFDEASGTCVLFAEGDWTGASFAGARIAHAAFGGAVLDEARLSGADLAGVQLNDARGVKASFAGARMPNATVLDATLQRCSFTDLDAPASNWRGSQLDGSRWTNARLQGAGLSQISCVQAVLSGADLTGARLEHASLRGAVLQKASLMTATLDGADLRGADLRGANLHGAEIWRADLDGAKLDGAILTRTKLKA